MASLKEFVARLRLESSRWVEREIIQGPQRDEILKLYETEAATEPQKKAGPIRLSTIVIIFAAVLLCTGIILFYAANWKRMPPLLKVVQVFALLIGTYGGAYYLLAVRQSSRLVGRVFLYAGMVSYGAGIMLTAQIFHISAHPANGVLAWAAGVLAISWVMKERWGYLFAGALFLVWNGWEFVEYERANYAFIGVPLLLGYLFYRAGSITGVVLCFFGILTYFYQVNVHWLRSEGTSASSAAAIFALLHIPLGVIAISLGSVLERSRVVGIAARISSVFGWVAIAIPFLTISWPMKLPTPYLVFTRGTLVFSLEWVLLLVVAGLGVYGMRKRGLEIRLPVAAVIYSSVLLALPLGNTSVRMVATHLGLLALLFGMLYLFGHKERGRPTERFLSFFFVISFIAVKCAGLMGMAVAHKEYFVAYAIGGLIFSVVVFLLNQLIAVLMKEKQRTFPVNGVGGACAITVFLLIYGLSFKMQDQRSVFDAELVVLVMLALFVGLAVLLYGVLWAKGAERLPIVLSGVIFAIATTVLLVARPGISWVVYSLVFNFLLFVTTGVFIYYSTKITSRLLLNFALGGFVVHIATRYFDLFWDLLSGSFLFIATGVVGVIGGWLLERNRRRLLRRMKRSEQGDG